MFIVSQKDKEGDRLKAEYQKKYPGRENQIFIGNLNAEKLTDQILLDVFREPMEALECYKKEEGPAIVQFTN